MYVGLDDAEIGSGLYSLHAEKTSIAKTLEQRQEELGQQLAHRNAQSSAGSQASSQGRLLLDASSLQLLQRHFDRVMQAIAQRLEQVRSIPNGGCDIR